MASGYLSSRPPTYMNLEQARHLLGEKFDETAFLMIAVNGLISRAAIPNITIGNPSNRVDAPDAILDYWFGGTVEAQKTRHWKGLKSTDDEIRLKFLATWEALSDIMNIKLAERWAAGGIRSVLALIIVWDQFSRSLWRGDAKAFSNDNRAGKLAMETLKSGAAAGLSSAEMQFLQMPLLHAESLEVHEWNASQPRTDKKMVEHIQGHLEVIKKYGRFPKRNAALGRKSTVEELEYMASDEAQGRPY